jgi:hypothetical protein
MSQTESTNEKATFICVRDTTDCYVMASLHPELGPIYLEFADNSDCNAADFYGITGDPKRASWFPERTGFCESPEYFVSQVIYCSDQGIWNDDEEDSSESILSQIVGMLEHGHYLSDSARKNFTRWLTETLWVPITAPIGIEYLADIGGGLGYRCQWTSNKRQALTFSAAEVADDDDLDTIIARRQGRFVSAGDEESAIISSIPASRQLGVNHALEAATYFANYKVQSATDRLVGKGNWSSVRPILRARAYRHAALAAEADLAAGRSIASALILGVPELAQIYSMCQQIGLYTASRAAASGIR